MNAHSHRAPATFNGVETWNKDTALTIEGLKHDVAAEAQKVREQPPVATSPAADHREAAPTNPGAGSRDTTQIDYAAILERSRVRPTDTIPPAPVCLIIEDKGQTYRVGTLGNISTISGKAKSKKTFAVSFAVAAAVGGKLIIDRVKGHLPDEKQNVLFFDTEQSREDVHRVAQRICRLSGMEDPPNLHIYSLRNYQPDHRLGAIEYAINTMPSVGLVVIDGVRDLAVDPITDAHQASVILTHLLQWSGQFGLHIMCVLHENKHDKTLRGFLGTELVNKSETVLSVTKSPEDSSVSTVAPEYCRGREFAPFSFAIDAEGYPHLVDTLATEANQRRKRKPTAADLNANEVVQMVNRAFQAVEALQYAQLRTNLIEAAQFIGIDLAKSRAEQLIRRIETSGLLIKNRPTGNRYEAYQINPDKIPSQLS